MNTQKYLKGLIDDLKDSGEQETQLTFKTLFRSPKDVSGNPYKYLWRNNKEIMIGIETDKNIN